MESEPTAGAVEEPAAPFDLDGGQGVTLPLPRCPTLCTVRLRGRTSTFLFERRCLSGETGVRQAELAELVRPLLNEEKCELVECSVSRTAHGQTFRVSIDREGGVPIEACAHVSRKMALLLDANPLLRGTYQLEVSSAGMHRPIWSVEHFLRFQGAPVRIELADPAANPRRIRGTIGPVEGERVRIRLEGNGGEIVLSLGEIGRAQLNLDPWKKREAIGLEGTDRRDHGNHGDDGRNP